MARTRVKVNIKRSQTFGLNITSLTDMFTILLVFLLQNFAAGDVVIDPVDGVRLPSSMTDKNPVDGAKVSISAKEIKFEQKVVAVIANNKVDAASLDAHDDQFIKPLFDELKKLNVDKEKLAKTGKVLLQADENLPYDLLRKVMYTASMAGFPNLKLVTTVSSN
ncbi:biopolymer transporter ExbD [Bdellovibrio sp. qaytius]|nr:biopolymer transporter ExbD [Bdellovibrio sp. qaytius]